MRSDLIYEQIGWMKCVACKDAPPTHRGQQWVFSGYIQCPMCNGRGEVPRYKVMDPRSGREIDYEGQRSNF